MHPLARVPGLATALTTLHGHLYRALYGDTEPTDDDVIEVRECCRVVKKGLG